MSDAVCFNCGKKLGIGKPMEDLLKDRFPVFCSIRCSGIFPISQSPDFDKEIEKLNKRFGGVA